LHFFKLCNTQMYIISYIHFIIFKHYNKNTHTIVFIQNEFLFSLTHYLNIPIKNNKMLIFI